MSRDRSTPKHWWTPSILKALGVFLAGFGAYWFAYDNLQPTVCTANYFGWEKVQNLVSDIPKCDGQWGSSEIWVGELAGGQDHP